MSAPAHRMSMFLILTVCSLLHVYIVYATTHPTFHYFSELVTFQQSKDRCSSRGLTLATPMSLKEQDAMLGVTSHFPVILVSDVWLGLERSDITGNFTWVEGTLPVWTNWAHGEPKVHLDCVALKKHTSREYNAPYQWYTPPCLNKKAYICQGECTYGTGDKYRGRVNVTFSGTPCLNWSDRSVNNELFPDAGLGEHNFCRNPGSASMPWCFVGNSKGWETCGIPRCCSRQDKDIKEGCEGVVNGNASRCSDGQVETQCCETCGLLNDVRHTVCPYGDIRSDCQSQVEANGPLLFSRGIDGVPGCCRTAAALIEHGSLRETFPTCPYNDVPRFTVGGVMNDCSGHIANLTAASVCSDFYFWCCQSCFAVLNKSEPDCPWGDSLACHDIILRHGIVACTWAGIDTTCCQTCSGLRNSSHTSCPAPDVLIWTFADVTDNCEGHIAKLTLSGVCDNQYLSKLCCSTCQTLETVTDTECSVDVGITYRGTRNVTIAGEPCIPWEQTAVNGFTYPGKGLGSNNYCRNPDNDDGGLWCFTEGGRGYCYVAPCGDLDCYVGDGSNYRGTTNVTIDGELCMPWAYSAEYVKDGRDDWWEKFNYKEGVRESFRQEDVVYDQYGGSSWTRHFATSHNFCRRIDSSYYGISKVGCVYGKWSEIDNTRRPLKTCSLLPCESFITCPYGDVSKLLFGGHLVTCQQLVHDLGLYNVCKNASLAPHCCGTCQVLRDITRPSCPYGDKDTKWCADHIFRVGPSFCIANELMCCKVCHEYKDYSNPECPYGDALSLDSAENCGKMISRYEDIDAICLYSYNDKCCGTCSFRPTNYTHPAMCTYTGPDSITINGETDTCNGHIQYYTAKHICTHHILSVFCCQRCTEIKDSNSEDCPWGDAPVAFRDFETSATKGFQLRPQTVIIRCTETIARHGLVACTWDNMADVCCETCSADKGSGNRSCPAPDVPSWTFDGVTNSCHGHIQNLTSFSVCGSSFLSSYCCDTCNKLIEKSGVADIDCFNGRGSAYRGNVNVNIDGKECRPWWGFMGLLYNHNYCRHPAGFFEGIPLHFALNVPWCLEYNESYTESNGFKITACDVPRCDTHIGCPFGDAAKVNMKGAFRSCREHVELLGAFSVCNDDRAKYCCQTCAELRDTTNSPCLYGDAKVLTIYWNGENTPEDSCRSYFENYGEWHVCGDPEYRFHCCESCVRLESAAALSSCPYRDSVRYSSDSPISCQQYIQFWGATQACSTTNPNFKCCESCSKLYDHDKPACPYGDAKRYYDGNDRITTCEKDIEEWGIDGVCGERSTSKGKSTASLCCATCAHLLAVGDADQCRVDEFRCRYTGKCISLGWRCDGSEDCSDGTDEEDCTSCDARVFTCKTGSQCVKCSVQCDGAADCRDGSDEEGCDGTKISCHDPTGSSKEDIVQVMQLLFDSKRYDKRVRPVKKAEDTLNVTIEVQLKSMFDVNENDQTMTTMCLVTMLWHDDFLKWSDGNLMKIVQNIQVKQENVWVPDITVGNIVSENWHMGDKHVTLRIDRNGFVKWSVNAFIVSECEIVVEYYPFDTQICSLDFTTEQSPEREIRLINYNDVHNHSALHIYGEDGTWRMIGYRIKNMLSKDGRQRQITRFSFYLARRHSFYLVSFIAPVILLSTTACLVFVLPADAGEKMGTSITVLLAFAVYLTIVTEYLPDTSLQVSYLALYLTVLLGLCTLSVILTTFILHIYHYPEDHPVGHKVTWLVNVLQKITCFSSKGESQQQHARDMEEIQHISMSELDEDGVAENPVDDLCSEEGLGQTRTSGSKYVVTAPIVEPLNWKIVSKTFDWFFYLSFTMIVVLVTVSYLGVSLYEGIVMADRHNSTGTLLPKFGRINVGVGLGGQADDSL